MFATSWIRPASKGHRPTTRLAVERLEDRDCPSGSYLLVSSYKTDNVLRYDAATGAFVDEFLPRHSGGLNQPWGVVIGPHDHNVYVSTGHFQGPGQSKSVLRYDGATGAFLNELVPRGQLIQPYAVTFGPDGSLYVGDRDEHHGRIARFDGTTGAYLNDFVPVNSGGLGNPSAHVFGPSGRGDGTLDLYVSDDFTGNILRYDGVTGAFLGVFIPNGSGVVSAGRGGLLQPFGILFGPDHNGDGQQDLYVTSGDIHEGGGFQTSQPHTSSVKVYDGVTGGYLADFVSMEGGGLNTPILMTFTETDPVTLAYRGTDALAATSLPTQPLTQMLASPPATPSGSTTMPPAGAGSSIRPHTTTPSSPRPATKASGTAWISCRSWSMRSATCSDSSMSKAASCKRRCPQFKRHRRSRRKTYPCWAL
jgi:hypothetical protein